MRTLAFVLMLLTLSCLAHAAPRIWLQYSDVPEALMVSNDSGAELKGCRAEWLVRYDGGLHYHEIARVDLPANGEVKVGDCGEWWDENRSKTLDVDLTLRGPDDKTLANQGYEGVFKVVPRQGLPTVDWVGTASRGGNTAAAFDGDPATRWDTGGTQKAGDFYLLDMRNEYRIAGLILDARGSANDYPGGLTVEVSVRGEKWRKVADIPDTESVNKRGRIKITFDPVDVQHILITLTKPHGESWFWSIHELSVLPAEGGEQASRGQSIRGGYLGGLAGLAAGALRAPEPGKTILLFCGSKGFRHTTCWYGKAAITKLGEESGAFKTICTEDSSFVNDGFLAGIDCLVINNSTGTFLNEDQRAALLRYVENGGAVAGIHAATDALYDWPEFPKLMGGWFDGHPWNEEVTIDVEVPDHPACQGVPNPWKIADEIYQQRDWSRDDLCVLMSLNTEQTNMDKQGIKRADRDFGIAWCRQVGKGRSFYTALGHRNEVMDDPVWQVHFLGGMRWAMGEVEGTSAPHAKRK
jgi:type 1 glutamine amidotransferase